MQKSSALVACERFFLAGCSSHRYVVNDPVARPFGSFQAVEIGSFASNVNSEAAKSLAASLPDRINLRLKDAKNSKTNQPLFQNVARTQTGETNVLALQGTVLSLEEGSRAKRYFVGFGAGKAFTTVECIFTDKSTGTNIARATFDGELTMGLFGGSSDEATEGVLNAIVKYINDNY